MKKSTKILLILFVIFMVPSLVMGKFIFENIKFDGGNININFDAKVIAGLCLIAVSSILGTILYFKFLYSISVDKVLFFTSLPLIAIYGFIIFLIAQLSFRDDEFSNFLKSILNISKDNTYNSILWAVLVSIVFVMLLFLNYLLICKPITKVEKIVSRLGDGIVREGHFNVGGGKQFGNIEHGLNKINNNYMISDDSLKNISLKKNKYFSKQAFRFFGRNDIGELEMGNEIKKRAITMLVKLAQIKDSLSMEENFNILNSYLHLICPIVSKYGGFVDKHLEDGVIAIFSRSERGLECASALSKAVSNKNRQNKSLPNLFCNISIACQDVVFKVEGEDEKQVPVIVSDVESVLSKVDNACRLLSANVVFTKNILDTLPLGLAIRYRYIGFFEFRESKVMMFENIDAYPRDVKEKLLKSKSVFEKGVLEYEKNDYLSAINFFENVLREYPNDEAAYVYFNKCKEKIEQA